MPMGRNRIVFASWYDYPQYYDILFQDFTQHEADFIEAACRKYCPFAVRRLLEPACGTGRLITELATRGYELIGFDISQPGLRYLRRQLARFRLYAEIFEADMSDFRIGQPADAAYCVINTFRYLLTEQAARGHLECLACSLRPGGIYILGLHLLPLGGYKEDSDCWTQRRSKTEVSVTARLLRPDRRRRIEDVQALGIVENDIRHHTRRPTVPGDVYLVHACGHDVSLRGSSSMREFHLLEPACDASQEPTPDA